VVHADGKKYDVVKMICRSFGKTDVFTLSHDPMLSYIFDFTGTNLIEGIEELILHELTKLPDDLYQKLDISSITYLSYLYQNQGNVEGKYPEINKEDPLLFYLENVLLNVSIDLVALKYNYM